MRYPIAIPPPAAAIAKTANIAIYNGVVVKLPPAPNALPVNMSVIIPVGVAIPARFNPKDIEAIMRR